MSSNPSQGQPPQQPGQGGDGASKERGDNNRTPRREAPPPGRPPQRQQGDAPWHGAFDEDAGDTRPNTRAEFANRS